MVCDRSPWATAPMTRAVSLVGWTRSPIRALTEISAASHEPLTDPSEARWSILPSLPTTRLIRSSSLAMRSLSSITSLNVSATLPATPVQSSGSRAEKSPFFSAIRAPSRVLWYRSLASVARARPAWLSLRVLEEKRSPVWRLRTARQRPLTRGCVAAYRGPPMSRARRGLRWCWNLFLPFTS